MMYYYWSIQHSAPVRCYKASHLIPLDPGWSLHDQNVFSAGPQRQQQERWRVRVTTRISHSRNAAFAYCLQSYRAYSYARFRVFKCASMVQTVNLGSNPKLSFEMQCLFRHVWNLTLKQLSKNHCFHAWMMMATTTTQRLVTWFKVSVGWKGEPHLYTF